MVFISLIDRRELVYKTFGNHHMIAQGDYGELLKKLNETLSISTIEV
jgi:hypothetical protein